MVLAMTPLTPPSLAATLQSRKSTPGKKSLFSGPTSSASSDLADQMRVSWGQHGNKTDIQTSNLLFYIYK